MAIVPSNQENAATEVGQYATYPFTDPVFQLFNVQQYYTQSGVVSGAQLYDVKAPTVEEPAEAENDAEAGVGHVKAGK